jgi:cobalt/nickel transport system permease protein
MHVPDGFLSPQITVPAYAVAAPVWVWAARRHFGPSATDALPVVAALTAMSLAVQTIMIPLPGGTSTHVVGITLLALRFHPLVPFVCESLVLLLQALFLGAGGITVLGVNALAMGLLGPLAGWLVHRTLRGVSDRWATLLAGYAAMQVSTLAVVLTLGLQHRLSPQLFPIPFEVIFTGMMLPSLTIGGAVEGLYTLFALSLLRRARLRGLAT